MKVICLARVQIIWFEEARIFLNERWFFFKFKGFAIAFVIDTFFWEKMTIAFMWFLWLEISCGELHYSVESFSMTKFYHMSHFLIWSKNMTFSLFIIGRKWMLNKSVPKFNVHNKILPQTILLIANIIEEAVQLSTPLINLSIIQMNLFSTFITNKLSGFQNFLSTIGILLIESEFDTLP
jgi:hypothetical protein